MSDSDQYSHEYPPDNWSREDLAIAFEEAPKRFPIPRYEDEDAWTALREDPLTAPVVERIIDRAEDAMATGYHHPTATEYLSVHRTGQPGKYDNNTPVERLGALALAECFERDGRFLDSVLDHAWGICDMATWFGAYHLNNDRNDSLNCEGLPHVLDPEDNPIDLSVSRFTHNIAEVDYLLGDRLHPALRERIRHTVDQRAITPYLENDDHWWLSPPTNNWCAVCNNGILSAALYLEDDPGRLAEIIEKGVDSLRHYLGSFDRDGCTSEGVGYWGFGVRKYTELAATLETRTDGKYSLFSVPVFAEIAQYPLRIELSPRRYVSFSDSAEEANLMPYVLSRVGKEFDLVRLAARGRSLFVEQDPINDLPTTIRNLVWCRESPNDEPQWAVPKRVFFRGWEWWISRVDGEDPDSLVVAAKGGHNHEAHNHNDCGSFMFHVGGESLLTDPGGPSYFEGYFGDGRYDHIAARSLGHSVPYVNGYEQASSVYPDSDSDYAAAVLERKETTDADTLALELAGCYPDEAGIESLRREFTVDRSTQRLVLEDRTSFDADAPGKTYVSVLISHFPMEHEDNGLVVTGAENRAVVKADGEADVTVEHLEEAIKDRDIYRACFEHPVESAESDVDVISRLTVSPEPH